jgi:hypothetical protein
MWEAAQPLRLSGKEREVLESFARAGNTPQKIVLRIRIVLVRPMVWPTTPWRPDFAPVDRPCCAGAAVLSRPE